MSQETVSLVKKVARAIFHDVAQNHDSNSRIPDLPVDGAPIGDLDKRHQRLPEKAEDASQVKYLSDQAIQGFRYDVLLQKIAKGNKYC